jgi:hypothetical protein
MIPFKKFYISEKNEDYGRYKYKIMNRLRENSDENLQRIINNMSGRASILSFPFDYNFESNILKNYNGPSALDVYSAERLRPQSKEQDVERLRVNKARKFMRNHRGSRVFFPAEYIRYPGNPGRHQGELIKIASKDVDVENVLNGKFGFVEVNKMGYRCGVIAYCGYVAADIAMDKLPVCDIIDLDYVAGPSWPMMMQIRKAYKYLKSGGLLMTGINLRDFRSGESNRDRNMFKMYTPRSYRTIGGKSFDVPEQQQREFGISYKDSFDDYNNITFNILNMLKDDLNVPLKPIYVNHYRGGTTNKGHAMLRLGFTK